ncbi:hypothetical protein BX616_000764 [Lobosporangium transversale]|uniref:BHLH domain-containing protein n=1 Tax=Lobosporangium transversale TaxID=64571 RepID=A0A1Y2GZR6_9FUNG|nr:hypothetical protein BCR41DRAFT_347132 [Lobosporangium transversale]KAF9917505.1 hypothetical protein BX616_000764 [Lobosporangium transversale]ORZ26963.1 hypothetical protein BCR41DRAFT_347132 [Lobosporangium transversale]|eukprot:XP_021884710.1 hypothetical protein BCR41DRAFT_347132 [Lobosporangium transversale]
MTATSTSSPSATPAKNVFRLHGVNVLNRKNVDSISRLTALEKRRATHILDERQRRDTMNQLLGELANLVRESAAELQQQQDQGQPQQKQYNADGTEKKPPVKSNSITTLRNAITEIRRLRACAGLETHTPPCAASLASHSSNGSRSSSPSEASLPVNKMLPQQPQHQFTLPPLAPMASQYDSRQSTPMSSPKTNGYQTAPAPMPPMASNHQLQSPPLSPSSPAPKQYSSLSPSMIPVHHSNVGPSLPSLFAPNPPVSFSSYSQNQHHSQQYCQQPSFNSSQHYYHSQQQQQHQYTAPRYESSQSHSRSSSPSFSGPMNSSGPSAPSMLLPQPYNQHLPTYQSSSF